MKKLCAMLLAIVLVAAANACAAAGAFDDYWDFGQPDGTYAYAFPRAKVPMDENWYRNTRVVLGDDGSTASFYHRASYSAYAAEGLTGGLLFTLGASADTGFQSLPRYISLGVDEEAGMNYYAELPTDYQAYTGDEAIRGEYDALWSGVEDVIAGIQIKGSAAYEALQGAEAAAPRVVSSGDYDYLIRGDTAAIARYTGDADVITIPSEINEYQVTEIAPEAFRYRKLKRVSIPGSIRSIGKQAFEYCEIADALVLPRGASIAENAFSYAKLPRAVVIPEGSTVEKCAFSYCEAMEQVVIESGTAIRGRAFSDCEDLAWAVCAEGSRLEADAFEYCRRMENAVLCGDVETAEGAFSGCGDLQTTRAEAGEFDALRQSALDGSLGGRGDSAPAEPGERDLRVVNSPAALEGVTVTLERATAVQDPKTGAFTYTFAGTLENGSDEGVMQVIYTFALIDVNGEEYRSFSEVFDGEDAAIPPHTRIDFTHDGIKWGKQSIPAAVEIGVASVMTEAELPPAHVPRGGEYLYQALGDEKLANIGKEPPVELKFHVDQGGYGRTAAFRAGSALDRAVELLCAIRIGAESDEWVTDNYNWIELTWKDGSRTGISLNLGNLEYAVHSTLHTYALENLGGFWSYCEGYLEEDA